MSITLSVALDKKKPNNLCTFAWKRNALGKGYWVSRERFQGLPANCIVHVDLQSQLTSLAKSRGISEAFDFAIQSVEIKKEKESLPKIRTASKAKSSRKPKRSNSSFISGFNPFFPGVK